MAVNSVSSKSDLTFTLQIRIELFTYNDRSWILSSFAYDIDNPPLLMLIFLSEDIYFSVLFHWMFSNSMKYSYSSAATSTHCVQFRPTMVWRNLWIGFNSAISASLFAAFSNHWIISDTWAAATTFFFCDDTCVIYAAWYAAAAAVFSFYSMILYWIRVKPVG